MAFENAIRLEIAGVEPDDPHQGRRGVGPVVEQPFVDFDDLPEQLYALLDVRQVFLALGDDVAQGAPPFGILADAAQGSIGA